MKGIDIKLNTCTLFHSWVWALFAAEKVRWPSGLGVIIALSLIFLSNQLHVYRFSKNVV